MKDDLIGRKEAKDALTNSLMELLDNMWDYNLFVIDEKVKDIINDLPIKGNEKLVWNIGRFNNAICPACCYDSKIRIDLLDWKYCPNCGTRLRKEHYENDSAED